VPRVREAVIVRVEKLTTRWDSEETFHVGVPKSLYDIVPVEVKKVSRFLFDLSAVYVELKEVSREEENKLCQYVAEPYPWAAKLPVSWYIYIDLDPRHVLRHIFRTDDILVFGLLIEGKYREYVDEVQGVVEWYRVDKTILIYDDVWRKREVTLLELGGGGVLRDPTLTIEKSGNGEVYFYTKKLEGDYFMLKIYRTELGFWRNIRYPFTFIVPMSNPDEQLYSQFMNWLRSGAEAPKRNPCMEEREKRRREVARLLAEFRQFLESYFNQ